MQDDSLNLKVGYFCKIKYTDLRKPKEQGGGTYEKYKFCFLVLSVPQSIFFFNSNPWHITEAQLKILPGEINPYVPHNASSHHKLKHISYLNLSQLKTLYKNNVSSAEEICEMPQPIVQKTINFFKNSMKGEPQSDSTISRRMTGKIICSLEDCLRNRTADKP